MGKEEAEHHRELIVRTLNITDCTPDERDLILCHLDLAIDKSYKTGFADCGRKIYSWFKELLAAEDPE